jgi:hypothetical protein
MSKQPRLPKASPPNGGHSSDPGSASSAGYGRPPTVGSTLKQPRNRERVDVGYARKAGRDAHA